MKHDSGGDHAHGLVRGGQGKESDDVVAAALAAGVAVAVCAAVWLLSLFLGGH